MAIIFGTLIGLIPLTVLLLVGFGIFSFFKKKDIEADQVPHALDVTYYIGMFVSLVASVGALIGILFAAIDHRFKDVLEMGRYYDELQVGSDVRISVAVLFVAFPIYLTLAWLLTGRIKADMARLKLTIRSFYLYAIILVTTLTVAGNLIYVIYNFLSGELFSRFAPKSLVLFVLALLVLGYHIYLLRRDYSKEDKVMPIVFSAIAVALVMAAVTYGILETGTPREIRARKLDDKRLQDLSQIQSLVLQKWQKDGVLPESLATLNNELAGSIIPVDPKTRAVYEYTVVQNSELGTGPVNSNYPAPINYEKISAPPEMMQMGRIGKIAKTDAVFEICATFEADRAVAKASGQDQYGYKGSIGMANEMYRLDSGYYGGDYSNPTWDHKAERTCFKRTISVKQYQIFGQ
jgi:Domain of unknown function (DUF5671)